MIYIYKQSIVMPISIPHLGGCHSQGASSSGAPKAHLSPRTGYDRNLVDNLKIFEGFVLPIFL